MQRKTIFTSKYLVVLSFLRPELVCSMNYPQHTLTGYCPSLQAGLLRHWEHIISFTAEGLFQG